MQIQDYYIQIKLNDVNASIISLYRLVLACTMLRRKHFGQRGNPHHYPRQMLSFLLILEHWRKTNYVAIQLMNKNTSVNNEENGEQTFSVLAKCVLGDTTKSNFQHLSDIYSLLPLYRDVKNDIHADLNYSTSLSWRHEIKKDSSEVAAAAFFFNQLVRRVQTSTYKTYDGTEASYKNVTAANANLIDEVSSVVYSDATVESIPAMFKEIKKDLGEYFVDQHKDLWVEGSEQIDIAPQPEDSLLNNSMNAQSSDDGAGFSSPEPEPHPVVYYGAVWGGCQVGHFAVTTSEFINNGRGISVCKILSISEEDHVEEGVTYHSFQGVEYPCTKKNDSPLCLKGGWHSNRASSTTKFISYNVIAYFPDLVSHKLPPDVVQQIKVMRETEELFKVSGSI